MKEKILVVGQTPPPYHGQALSTKRLLRGDFEEIELFHVRLAFSDEIDEVGRFQVKKIFRLLKAIFSIVVSRFRYSTSVFYYMPACSGKIPFYRDLAILLSTRWLFKKTVFHFRSAGIDEVYEKLNTLEKSFFKLAYNDPDLAIQLSASNPLDAEFVKAKQKAVVPNGISDHFLPFQEGIEQKEDGIFKILYIGSIRRSKGVFDLIEACNLLKEKYEFKLYLVGQFATKGFENEIHNYIRRNKLSDYIEITGVLVGEEKWRVFAQSDLLCFPTFYENESFGNVLLEAMQFRLPIVATNWRAVGTIIKDGENGFLVPVREPKLIAYKIEYLINNPDERRQIGRAGRKEYLNNYSVEKFWSNMEKVLANV